MDDAQYDNICDNDAGDFEGQEFPLQSINKNNKRPITFFTIVGTGGDGSYDWEGQTIGVDAGMLCIAKDPKGWKEKYGATFETLNDAEEVLKEIIKNWNS